MNILITGATSGIGKKLALDYKMAGNNVIGIGRNSNELEFLRQNDVIAIEADVTSTESLERAIFEVNQIVEQIDLLILNAGSCKYVDIQSFSSATFKDVMSVNFFGMVNCIEYFLPLLRKSNSPHLVGISSIASYLPLPRAEAYGASKAAVNYLLEAIAIDLISENILVTVVNPGFVDTPLTRLNDFPMPFIINPDKASQLIIKGIAKRKTEISFPKRLTISIKIASLIPKTWWRKIAVRFKK